MKTRLLFSILLLLIQSSFLRAEGWEYVGSLTNESMQKVTTQGLDTVFVVGYNGLIAKSTDRGLTWSKQYYASKSVLNDIVFVNHTTGYAVGEKGTLLKTTDSGANWVKQITFTKYTIRAIAAASPDNVWAVGDSSLVLHSTDGGQSWQKVNLTSSLVFFKDIKFKNGNGIIVGNSANIYVTKNAGNTWDRPTSLLDVYSSGTYSSISMTENKSFILNRNYGILISSDNMNWNNLGSKWYNEEAMCFVNDNVGYYCTLVFTTCGCDTGYAQIYKTTNGGTDWTFNVGGRGNSVENFNFANDTIGYFLTDVALYRTPDKGSFYFKEYNGLENKYVQPTITLKQQDNNLIVGSADKTISVIEIRSLTGARLYSAKIADKEQRINVSQIPQGVYVIHTLFADNSSSAVKWVKQ